ncbi:MAG: hypothetical protein ACTS73_07575 [Arsenophonus sp. NEOnobi-MAG3]
MLLSCRHTGRSPIVLTNGYLPQLTIQTTIDHVQIKIPKVRGIRIDNGISFNNSLLRHS